jgi:Flp pilus assembly protein TadB
MTILIEKILELYRNETIVMFQLNLIVSLLVYLIISILEDKKNHIAKQLNKKIKVMRKSKGFKFELDLENGTFSSIAHKVEQKMEKKLENANVNFTAKEFSFFFVVGILVSAGVGFLFFPNMFYNIFNLLTGNLASSLISRVASTIAFGFAGMTVPFIILKFKISKRKKDLSDQLIDFIMSLADGLKSASTTQDAIREVSKEMADPLASELKKVVGELEYAIPFEEAMENLKRRIDLPEYSLVISAMQIQSRTGSHLEKMLRNMAKVSEERREIKDDVLKIVRQTKTTAYILLAAPFVLGGGMFLMMPDMAIPAYTSGIGMIVLGAFAVIYVITVFIIREIDKFVAKSL